MPAVGFSSLLAFVAAAGIGVSTVAVKRGLVRVSATGEASPVIVAAFVGIVVSVAIFWSAAVVRGIPTGAMTPVALAPFLVAGVLYPGMFRILYYTGIDRIGANVVGALVAANPAVAALLAVPVLGERVTAATGGGLLLIVGGGMLLQFASPDTPDSATDIIVRELGRANARDIGIAIAATIVVGVAYVLIKLGLTGFAYPVTATAITQTAGLTVFVLLFAGSPETRAQLRRTTGHRAALGIFVFAGAAVAVGWLSQFAALQVGSVVVVIPLVNTYPLVIATLSYALARELPRSPRVIGGIVAIIIGASAMQAL